MEFSDVAPETKGSALGDIKIGKPNVDFFVIPSAPITPAQMRGDFPTPAENVVVFKTRERQPLYKAARVAGTPVRMVSRVYTFVVDSFVSIAFGWMKKKEPKQPVVAAPIAYPESPRSAEPFAHARSLGYPVGPSTAYELSTTQTLRYGG